MGAGGADWNRCVVAIVGLCVNIDVGDQAPVQGCHADVFGRTMAVEASVT
jgi:hypothetical protein